VNRRILNAIQPGPDDFLVDIGCGDATLLRMAHMRTPNCIGIVGTVEEAGRLASTFPGLNFEASNAQALSLESEIASKIVCNATLFYLPSESDVMAALREMARIARPGATIWIGEIPEIDEYAYYGTYRGTSMIGLLWHLLRHNGIRSFLGLLRRWMMAVIGSERIVLNSAGMFHASPEGMQAMAEKCGLRLETFFRHEELDQVGNVVNSKFRYNYIFTIA